MASGQAAMLRRRNTTELTNPFSVQTLARLLHLLDTLTQNTYLDAQDAGPFFLHSLLRIVPAKLPIDLRPVMLRVVHRLAMGMARDTRPEGKCFDKRHAIAILHALTPVLENPRSGASASFVVNEIKTVVETCLQREMKCGDPPFRISTPKLEIELGMVEGGMVPEVLSTDGSLCGATFLQLPSLLGISAQESCLGYRCAFAKSNLMRNGSVDSNVAELVFRNASMVLAPSFRSRSINFTLPLTTEFSRRVQKGGKPMCVWYEREANATVSRWNEKGCKVTGFNRRHVNCSCTHLTEFSVMIPEVKRPLNLRGRWFLLAALLAAVMALGSLAIWSLHRRHRYEREVKLGLREPRKRKMHGPPTLEQHMLRRQWRLRDSDQDTLLMEDQDDDDRTTSIGSRSTLAPGSTRRESRHRTVSMASTLYRSEPDADANDSTAASDSTVDADPFEERPLQPRRRRSNNQEQRDEEPEQEPEQTSAGLFGFITQSWRRDL